MTLALGGCATNTNVRTDTSLRSFRTITLSCKDTPETRKQILAHDSAFDTLKSGKVVAYKDTCQEAPKPAKTS